MVDISSDGAKVEARTPLKPGQTLNLVHPEDPSSTLRCFVVWTGDVATDGDGRAGLEFLDPPDCNLEN